MLILGKDKWLPGKETWSWNSCALSVGYNQPGKEGWKLLFVTRMKPFQSEINSGRSAVPSPWTLSKERDTGPRVGSTGRQHFKLCASACIRSLLCRSDLKSQADLIHKQEVETAPSVLTPRKPAQTSEKEKRHNQGKRRRERNKTKKQETSRKVQAVYNHSSWPKIRVVGVTTELGGRQWGQGGLQLWQKLLQKEAVSDDLEVPSELSQACSLCLSHFTSYIKPGTHMRLSNQRGG